MVKCIVVKVVLGLMFVMSSTVLFSQDSKVKYPDISGVWSMGQCITTITQYDGKVIMTHTCGTNLWYDVGDFIDNKTVQTKSMGRSSTGCVTITEHTYTLTKNGNLINEWVYNDSNCGYKKGSSGSNTLTFVMKFRYK